MDSTIFGPNISNFIIYLLDGTARKNSAFSYSIREDSTDMNGMEILLCDLKKIE
jgi:hypothetical protein